MSNISKSESQPDEVEETAEAAPETIPGRYFSIPIRNSSKTTMHFGVDEGDVD